MDPDTLLFWLLILGVGAIVVLIRWHQERADEGRRQEARKTYERQQQERAKVELLEDIEFIVVKAVTEKKHTP